MRQVGEGSKKLAMTRAPRHPELDRQLQVLYQAGDTEPDLVDEETRFTNKSTDRDAPGRLSKLAMMARTSRRVKGSTG